ncbi:hypothetical protein MRB53_038407 [Persea americana]|nr:hypothetical protein MRB53_038407 [Persea americana]
MNDSSHDQAGYSVYCHARILTCAVVRTPEEAAESQKGAFDYVLLCIKALPDVYDIAAVIESVVTPQHTCILINTSHSLGIETYIEERFPKNVVLSLVSSCGDCSTRAPQTLNITEPQTCSSGPRI